MTGNSQRRDAGCISAAFLLHDGNIGILRVGLEETFGSRIIERAYSLPFCKLARLLLPCALLEEEINVHRLKADTGAFNAVIRNKFDCFKNPFGIKSFILNRFGKRVYKNYAPAFVGRDSNNLRVKIVSKAYERTCQRDYNHNAVDHLEVGLTRFLLTAIEPQREQNSECGAVTGKSLQSCKAEGFEFKRKKDSQRVFEEQL